MSFLHHIFNPDGLVKVDIDDIPDDLPSGQKPLPELLRRKDFLSGELQRRCQEALLRLRDQGKPLGALMTPKYTRPAANALLALSHPCPRHLDLFAYCIELFENGEGGLRTKGSTVRKLQSLMAYNPLNLAKIIKLHGDEPQFYQIMKPVHELLSKHVILLDDPDLAQRLERLERCEDTPARKASYLHRHNFNHYISDTHFTQDSAMREYLHPGLGLGHEEIHERLKKFLGQLVGSRASESKFALLPSILKDEYWADGPSLTPSIEIIHTDVTLEDIKGFPGLDQFLLDHSFHFLQELNTNPSVGHMPVHQGKLELIQMMTRKALQAGYSTEDIHFTSIFKMNRYRRQDILNRGEDMTKRWVKGTLDLAAKGYLPPVALAIIGVLLEHEGVEKVMSYGLSEKQLLTAKEITGDNGFAQGLSPRARDQMMGRDLGL